MSKWYVADIYSHLSASRRSISHNDTALKYAKKAYDIAEELDDDKMRTNYLRRIGEIEMDFENYDKADTIYKRIYSLGIKTNQLQVSDFRNIGILYLHKGDIAKAKEFSRIVMSVDSNDTDLERFIALDEGDIRRAYRLLNNHFGYQTDYIINKLWANDF